MGQGQDFSASWATATETGEVRAFYDALNARLDGTTMGRFAAFLNYGYVPDDGEQSIGRGIPGNLLDRNSIALVLETVRDVEVGGRSVLDVGSGRGGTLSVLKTFRPKAIVGVDLSWGAVSFCRRRHSSGPTAFVQADAERLPFRDRTFDLVTNIESSHGYPRVEAFYEAIARVLVPEGRFLLTDIFTAERHALAIDALGAGGLPIELDRDITPNVLRSCDEAAERHLQAFGSDASREMVDFLGVPGSVTYGGMVGGELSYRIMRFRRVEG